MLYEGWTEANKLRLHYLANVGTSGRTPLVYVPGSLGSAEDFRTEMGRLAPRPCIAVSPRGTGRSSAPETGYGLADRMRDLEQVLDDVDPPPFCLMAFSRGVPIALRYATLRPERVRGLILLDFPARYARYSERWVEGALPVAREQGVPEHVVRRMQHESRDEDLWDELAVLVCPVLIVRGGQSQALSEAEAEWYQRVLPQAEIVVFEDAGHEVFRPDYERFMRTIEAFLERLDGGA